MKIINTNFHGLKIIKGINYHDKRGYLREIFKNSFLRKICRFRLHRASAS